MTGEGVTGDKNQTVTKYKNITENGFGFVIIYRIIIWRSPPLPFSPCTCTAPTSPPQRLRATASRNAIQLDKSSFKLKWSFSVIMEHDRSFWSQACAGATSRSPSDLQLANYTASCVAVSTAI